MNEYVVIYGQGVRTAVGGHPSSIRPDRIWSPCSLRIVKRRAQLDQSNLPGTIASSSTR
jgi:hypothetical protein